MQISVLMWHISSFLPIHHPNLNRDFKLRPPNIRKFWSTATATATCKLRLWLRLLEPIHGKFGRGCRWKLRLGLKIAVVYGALNAFYFLDSLIRNYETIWSEFRFGIKYCPCCYKLYVSILYLLSYRLKNQFSSLFNKEFVLFYVTMSCKVNKITDAK